MAFLQQRPSLHGLPAGRKLYSSRMRSVLQALRTSDFWVLQLAWNDAFASAYTMLLYVIEVGYIAMRAMVPVGMSRDLLRHRWRFAGMISCMFWDFGLLFRVVVVVRHGDLRWPGRHRQHHGWTWPRSPSGFLQELGQKESFRFLWVACQGLKVLHICPDWSAAQLVAHLEKTAHLDLSGCYLMMGHKVWSGGSVEEFGIEGGVRITVRARLLGGSAFQCWTCPQCEMTSAGLHVCRAVGVGVPGLGSGGGRGLSRCKGAELPWATCQRS